jgi:nitrogen regulatory protein P-II 1
MALKKIVAIIREERINNVISHFQEKGVPGASFSKVRGYGEYVNPSDGRGLAPCIKIEVITDEGVTEKVARFLMQLANTGVEGDGIIAITPVEKLYRIRDQKEIEG